MLKILDAVYKLSIWLLFITLLTASGLFYSNILHDERVIRAGERAYSECHNDRGWITIEEPTGVVR